MTLKLGLINDVQLRFLCPQDLEEVKRLCREWFPIEYPETWYCEITSNPKFFSLAATYSKSIVGLLVAEVKVKSKCNREDAGILSCAYSDDTQLAYILSIGVVKEFRRQSIGCLLLDSLISHLTTPEQCNCKAVYLHVLASNQVAVQFYENRRFYKFRYLPLYYSINGAHRDGHLYVLYINGGEPPWTFPDVVRYAGRKIFQFKPCKVPFYLVNYVCQWLMWFSPIQTVRDSCVRTL